MTDGAMMRNPKMVERKKTNLHKARKAVCHDDGRKELANDSVHGSSVNALMETVCIFYIPRMHLCSLKIVALAAPLLLSHQQPIENMRWEPIQRQQVEPHVLRIV